MTSCRASQWKTRPDYALLDLYNVLYRPQLSFIDSPLSETCVISFSAPIVAAVNGVNVNFQWRKGKITIFGLLEENKFENISLTQLAQLNGANWQMFPNRSGWKLTFTYDALCKELGLSRAAVIDFKVTAQVYPLGMGGRVLTAFDTEYSLPVKYYPDNKDAPKEQQITRHKPEPAQALRNISLAPPQLRAHIYEKY